MLIITVIIIIIIIIIIICQTNTHSQFVSDRGFLLSSCWSGSYSYWWSIIVLALGNRQALDFCWFQVSWYQVNWCVLVLFSLPLSLLKPLPQLVPNSFQPSLGSVPPVGILRRIHRASKEQVGVTSYLPLGGCDW